MHFRSQYTQYYVLEYSLSNKVMICLQAMCDVHVKFVQDFKLYLSHTQLALVMFSQYSAAVVRHKANDGVASWFKYDTALSAVV